MISPNFHETIDQSKERVGFLIFDQILKIFILIGFQIFWISKLVKPFCEYIANRFGFLVGGQSKSLRI